MNEKDSICALTEQWAVEYSYANLKCFHRKYRGEQTLYITTKGAYKVESGRLISLYLHPRSTDLIKSDYSTLTYTYRIENETQTNRPERDSDDG